MIKKINLNTTIEDMSNILKEDGVFIIKNFVSGDTLKSLHDETMMLCESSGGYYEFGRNYRGGSLNTFSKTSNIFQIFDSDWMRKLNDNYTTAKNNYCNSIFATYDYKNDKGLARNGWLHFDRANCLKFFIYLTDIDEDSGALQITPGSIKLGKQLRKDAIKNSNSYETIKNRIEVDYPELLEKYKPEPIEEKAGTLIVFDTDAFHKGGLCKEGKHRLVLRAHCINK